MVTPEDSLRAVMEAQSCLEAGYLFGSVVRGTAAPWSDVDVALVFAATAPREERERAAAAVAQTAEREFGRVCVPIDLCEQGVIFQLHVVRAGRLLFVRDRRAHARFVARVILEGLDFLPTYRIFERAQGQYLRRLAGR